MPTSPSAKSLRSYTLLSLPSYPTLVLHRDLQPQLYYSRVVVRVSGFRAPRKQTGVVLKSQKT